MNLNLPPSGAHQSGKRFGPYRILEEVARGGQGVVMKARHEQLGTLVALKMLIGQTPKRLALFRQEAKVLAELKHPHLLKVTDLGEQNQIAFLAMEFIEGDDLDRIVSRHGVPDFDWTGQVLSQVADALEYCHGRGVIHRDLKPANVLIEKDTGRAVLVDFGLIKRDPEQMRLSSLEGNSFLTKTGELKGTPKYMAPEQAHGSKFGQVTAQTDVYALGSTLYYLLTGEAPFEGISMVSVIANVIGADPPDPRKVNPEVPAALARLCQRALAKKAEHRPASAAEFAKALRAAAFAPPVPSSAVPLRASLVLNAVLGLAVLVAVTWGLTAKPPAAPAPAAPSFGWPTALRVLEAGGRLSSEELGQLAEAAGGTPPEWARWLPHARVQSALSGAGKVGAEALAGLPNDPSGDLLRAEVLVGQADSAAKGYEALLRAEAARLPWRSDGPAARWGAFAAQAKRVGARDVAARAYLRRAERLRDAKSETSLVLAAIERAFEVDARTTALDGRVVADFLLVSARDVLLAASRSIGSLTPARAPGLAQARRSLVRYRLILPDAQIPRPVLRAMWQVGSLRSSPQLRSAVLPGMTSWGGRWLELERLVFAPAPPGQDQRWIVKGKREPFPPGWGNWIRSAERGKTAAKLERMEDFLLFRPELAVFWVHLSYAYQHFERWRLAEHTWQVWGSKDRLEPSKWLAGVAACMTEEGRHRSALEFVTRAVEDLRSKRQVNYWLTHQKVRAHLRLGQAEQALQALETVRHTALAKRGLWWISRADALEALGRPEEAKRSRQQAYALDAKR